MFANGVDLPLIDGPGCTEEPCTLAALEAGNTVTAPGSVLADPDRGDFAARRVPGWNAAPAVRFDWSDAPLDAPAWDIELPAPAERPGAA